MNLCQDWRAGCKKDVHLQSKAEYEEMIGELKTKKDELQAKFKKLMDGSDDEWEECRTLFLLPKIQWKKDSQNGIHIQKVADGTPETTSSRRPASGRWS